LSSSPIVERASQVGHLATFFAAHFLGEASYLLILCSWQVGIENLNRILFALQSRSQKDSSEIGPRLSQHLDDEVISGIGLRDVRVLVDGSEQREHGVKLSIMIFLELSDCRLERSGAVGLENGVRDSNQILVVVTHESKKIVVEVARRRPYRCRRKRRSHRVISTEAIPVGLRRLAFARLRLLGTGAGQYESCSQTDKEPMTAHTCLFVKDLDQSDHFVRSQTARSWPVAPLDLDRSMLDTKSVVQFLAYYSQEYVVVHQRGLDQMCG
jgi:hypothetical protein